jgi:hypothetical protein
MALPYKPQRTFNGAEGAASVGDAGPTGIKNDTNEIVAMFDPLAVHGDGTAGGIAIGNFAAGEATATPTANKLVLYDGSGNLPGSIASAANATNAANVTTNINGHAITDILESDGVTVKNATAAITAGVAEAAKGDTRFQICGNVPAWVSSPALASGSDTTIQNFMITLPAGKSLVLKGYRYNFNNTSLALKVVYYDSAKAYLASPANLTTGGDKINLNHTLYTAGASDIVGISIIVYVHNSSTGSNTWNTGGGWWLDLAIE